MRVIIGGIYYSTPEGSSVRITRSMTDPVPSCALSIRDNASAINIIAPQEILVIDDQVIPNPTMNLLQDPAITSYNSGLVYGWGAFTYTGVTTAQIGGGGVQATFSNASNISNNPTFLEIQALPAGSIVPGLSYSFSFYAQGSSTPTNIGVWMQIAWTDAAGTIFGATPSVTGTIPAPTSLTRTTLTATAPAGASGVIMRIGFSVSSATNSGVISYYQAQIEANLFPFQSYPTPWCGPSQTNCVQLPLGQYIRQYRKFAGFVTKVSPGDYHGNIRTIQVSAVGYAWLAGTMFGNDTFSSKTDKQIITTLMSKYFLSNGVAMTTLTNVVQGVTASSTQLNWDDLRTALDGICGLSGFYWTIDFYWNVIYAPPGYFNMTISLICDNSSIPDMVVTFPAYSFKPENDFTQPGSNILVLGNSTNTAQVIDPSRIGQLGLTCGYSLPTTTSWMRKINDSTLASVADCTQRGMAELIQYDNVRGIYHLTTNVELIAGQGIRVTSNTDGLNQTMLLIQQVTASWIGTSETLTDVWEYAADLGSVNRAATNIISRIFRQTNKNTAATAINTVTLAVLENVSVIDQVDANSVYAMAVLADSPLRYYRLGEPAGFSITTAYDWSGGINGTITNPSDVTLGTPGLLYNDPNTAYLLGGISGYVNAATTSLPTGAAAWSLEAWINTPSLTSANFRTVVEFGTGSTNHAAAIFLDTVGHICCNTYAANRITGPTITINTTYHVVATYDATNLRLYVNGVLQGTLACTPAITLTYCRIGSEDSVADDFYGGAVDEVSIYSTVLSPQHILTHYIAGTTGVLSPQYASTILALLPLAYYRLGEPSGTTANDSSTNGYNGTIGGTVTLGQPGAIALDFNGAILLNGSTGKIDLAAGLSTTGLSALTFEAWVNLSNVSFVGNVRIFSNDHTSADHNGCELVINASGASVNMAVGNGTTNTSLTATFAFAAAQWYHIVGTWAAGGRTALYINGSQVNSTSVPAGTIAAATNNMAIGYSPASSSGTFFPGLIDEAAVYPVQLTAAQVQQHYNIGTLGHS